jgi:hypothetical protein
VPEGGVDEPPLSIAERDVPAVPDPGVLRLPVPLEVADVAGFEIDAVAVMGTQERDAGERTRFGLTEEDRGKRCADEPEPPVLHYWHRRSGTHVDLRQSCVEIRHHARFRLRNARTRRDSE